MNKQQLEQELEKIKRELESTKADCGILLEENNELIDKILVFNKDFDFNSLFTAKWREEYLENKIQEKKMEIEQ